MTPIQKMTSGAGRVLGGRYTLLTPIAQGGMGEVYAARQNALTAAGWTVIRTNWHELTKNPEVFVAALRRVLAARS